MSKAFDTYKTFRDQVKEQSPHTADGKQIITVSTLKPSTKNKSDQIFYLNSKSNEAILFTLSIGGKLKSATYIDKDAEEHEKTKFVAKDYDKLVSLVKDPALVKIAANLDWTKTQDKAAEAEAETEVEAEEPPFGE